MAEALTVGNTYKLGVAFPNSDPIFFDGTVVGDYYLGLSEDGLDVTLEAVGTGTGYADGKSVSNLAKSGEVTLYAQWELTVYTITFTDKTGGHTITPSSVEFTYSATEDKVIEISFEGTIEHTQVNAPLTVKYDISELDVKKITILKGSYGGDVSVSIWFE